MKRKLLTCTLLALCALSICNNKTMKVNAEENYLDHFEGIEYKTYSDVIMFWTNQEGVKDLYLPGSETEQYDNETSIYNGMSYIAKTSGGRIWCSFASGGFLEPDVLNYSLLKYSDDDGKTWSSESIVIDCITPENHRYPPILFYDNGKLICYYGTTVFYFDNPDCANPSENLNFPKSIYYSGIAPAHAPLKLSEHYYITTCENSSNPTSMRVVASTNALVWEDIATAYSAGGAGKKWQEGQIAKLSDGKLMMLSRIDSGSGVEMTISEDEEGYSWQSSKTDLGSPLEGPYSKLCLVNTKDGGLLLINHDSVTAREKITCFLSYDDGKTWPYKYVLDDRQWIPSSYWGISYPDAIVDDDNNVYITWDQRTPTCEILCAKLSIDDIKAGKIVTEGSYNYASVRKSSEYYNIASIEEKFEQNYEVEVGTDKNEIISKLPTTINYVDTKGNSKTVTGSWVSTDYNANEEGLYSLYFEIDDRDEYLLDSYSLLKVRIKVKNSKGKGCNGSTSTSMPILALALLLNKRKSKTKRS